MAGPGDGVVSVENDLKQTPEWEWGCAGIAPLARAQSAAAFALR
jgi:hypothetical protein